MSIVENLAQIKSSIPDKVSLVAVSKTKPDNLLEEAYQAGQRIFGENKVQELCGKFERLPKDIQWHMIGHLQSNKVKYIAPFVNLIHAVDSLKLAKEINKQAVKNNRTINVLLQIHIAEESAKFGFNQKEIFDLINSNEFNILKNINVCGLMGMATFTDNTSQITSEFKRLKSIFDQLKIQKYNPDHFKTLSMGMSGDYQIAIKEGSNMIRVGSAIFGKRG